MEQLDEELDAEREQDGEGDEVVTEQPDAYAGLRRMRNAISEDKDKDIDIPGYHGRLVAKFRKVGHEEVERVNRRVADLRDKHNPNAALIGQCDVLVTALIGVYLRKDLNKRDEMEPLSIGYGENGSGEASWLDTARVVLDDDKQLPESATPRDAVRAVIGNDLAIAPFHMEYVAWARSLFDEEETDFTLSF